MASKCSRDNAWERWIRASVRMCSDSGNDPRPSPMAWPSCWDSRLQRAGPIAMAAEPASALQLVLSGDAALYAIVRLSLAVSLSATLLATLLGAPLGALIALSRFPGRQVVTVALNALMGLPPVIAGLAIYLLLSRSGPLGSFGLLFTPQAMVITQTLLVLPIIAALSRQTVEDLWMEYRDELAAMGVRPLRRIRTLLWDARFSLVTALLAGFGRAAAEVGSIIIVGGNIEGHTRTMTTSIALETSRGNLPLAMGLGLVLIAIILLVNIAAWGVRQMGGRFEQRP
jgi:tungstate transport system permease protein